jgi:hypothetical protein
VTTGYYRDAPDPERLLPRERLPLVGRRVRAGDGKQRGDRSLPTRPQRALVLAGASVIVVALAGAALIAGAGSDGDGSSSGSREGTAGSKATRAEVSLLYRGGSAAEGTPGEETIVLVCSAEGCRFLPPNIDGDDGGEIELVGGRWRYEHISDMGEICRGGSTGVAKGRELIIDRWDFGPVGTTTQEGIEVPARLVGTVVREVPPVPDCLDGSRSVYELDAEPDPPDPAPSLGS